MGSEENERYWKLLVENSHGYVRIVCKDGEEIHAALHRALEDKDGTRHVIYDVLWSNRPAAGKSRRFGAFETGFDEIESVEMLPQDTVGAYLNDQIKLRT